MTPLETIELIRPTYPTPLGSTHPAFLIECASKTGLGLLKKPTGHNVMLPDGTAVAQDILMETSGQIWDFLIDGEGAATPTWQDKGIVEIERYYAVPSSVPTPSPEPPPNLDLEERVAFLEEDVEDLQANLFNLEVEVFGLKSQVANQGEQLNMLTQMVLTMGAKLDSLTEVVNRPMRAIGKTNSGWGHTHTLNVPVERQ